MDISEIECACQRFERLEGVATQAYITQFLERDGSDEEVRVAHYTCRVCGASWVWTEADGPRKSSLVKQQTDFYV